MSLAKYLPGGSKIAFQVKLDHGVEFMTSSRTRSGGLPLDRDNYRDWAGELALWCLRRKV